MVKKIVPALMTALLLLGCSNTADEAVRAEDTEIVDEVESVEDEMSYFTKEIQTKFNPVTTELRELTPEQEEIIWEIEEHVNEVTSKPNYNDEGEKIYYGDRELVEMVAGDYPDYTADELYHMRNSWYVSRIYSEFGDQYISNRAHFELIDSAIKSNLKNPGIVDEWVLETGTIYWDRDRTKSINIDTYHYNGQEIEVKVYMSYNDDYSEAALERLFVDGEDAIEFTEEKAKEFEDVKY